MIQKKLNHHESFLFDFLRGMRSPTHETPPTAKGAEEQQSYSTNCHLPILDFEEETSVALKRKIAEFMDVPLGNELRSLRSCSAGLSKSLF